MTTPQTRRPRKTAEPVVVPDLLTALTTLIRRSYPTVTVVR